MTRLPHALLATVLVSFTPHAHAQDAGYGPAQRTLRDALAAPEEERARLFELAATRLIEAVNAAPDHENAPRALVNAGVALENVERLESALRVYERAIDEVTPLQASTPERTRELDSVLATAYFRTALLRLRRQEPAEALPAYRALADSARFARSSDPEVRERVESSLVGAATLLEQQRDYARAATYWRLAAGRVADPRMSRVARYRVGEMAHLAGDEPSAVRDMRGFIDRYANDREAQELVITAYWRIAQARARSRPAIHRAALQDVVTAFSRSGLRPGSTQAAYAAEAHLELIEHAVAEAGSFRLRPVRVATLEAGLDALQEPLVELSRSARALSDRYDVVMGYRSAPWTLRALQGQARIYERLATAIRATRARGARRPLREQWSAALEERARPAECLALVRYVLAARAGRAGSLSEARPAFERLRSYPQDRVAACVTERRLTDPTLAAYTPGELSEAPPSTE